MTKHYQPEGAALDQVSAPTATTETKTKASDLERPRGVLNKRLGMWLSGATLAVGGLLSGCGGPNEQQEDRRPALREDANRLGSSAQALSAAAGNLRDLGVGCGSPHIDLQQNEITCVESDKRLGPVKKVTFSGSNYLTASFTTSTISLPPAPGGLNLGWYANNIAGNRLAVDASGALMKLNTATNKWEDLWYETFGGPQYAMLSGKNLVLGSHDSQSGKTSVVLMDYTKQSGATWTPTGSIQGLSAVLKTPAMLYPLTPDLKEGWAVDGTTGLFTYVKYNNGVWGRGTPPVILPADVFSDLVITCDGQKPDGWISFNSKSTLHVGKIPCPVPGGETTQEGGNETSTETVGEPVNDASTETSPEPTALDTNEHSAEPATTEATADANEQSPEPANDGGQESTPDSSSPDQNAADTSAEPNSEPTSPDQNESSPSEPTPPEAANDAGQELTPDQSPIDTTSPDINATDQTTVETANQPQAFNCPGSEIYGKVFTFPGKATPKISCEENGGIIRLTGAGKYGWRKSSWNTDKYAVTTQALDANNCATTLIFHGQPIKKCGESEVETNGTPHQEIIGQATYNPDTKETQALGLILATQGTSYKNTVKTNKQKEPQQVTTTINTGTVHLKYVTMVDGKPVEIKVGTIGQHPDCQSITAANPCQKEIAVDLETLKQQAEDLARQNFSERQTPDVDSPKPGCGGCSVDNNSQGGVNGIGAGLGFLAALTLLIGRLRRKK